MKPAIFFTLLLLYSYTNYGQNFALSSPDQQIEVRITFDQTLSFTATHNGTEVIAPSVIDLNLEGSGWLCQNATYHSNGKRTYQGQVTPVVAQKSSSIEESYNELIIRFKQNFKVHFRAYNDGIAYRFETTQKKDQVVINEKFELNFPGKTMSWFPKEESMISHYERVYINENLSAFTPDNFCSLPVLMKPNGINVLLTEADLFDYPGLFMRGTGDNGLVADFPKYVETATPMEGSEDRNQIITEANHIARTSGNRTYPWRVMVISDRDEDLIASELVFLLSRENQIKDPSWIQPGQVAWDWYNALNIYGVDFESGINNETYKYYIDFAAQYGIEYIILDEGWTQSTTNIRASTPAIDVPELVAYGKEKNIGIILWMLWGPLDQNLDVLSQYHDWGVKGIKVDFMQRADQYMVNYYEKVAREAAKYELLVDYHGAFKPSGLRRAYPNVINYEGVKGNENNKWSKDITPEHNVTLPFTRMVAGPMDFTPGSMVNTNESNFAISFTRPMSMGSRAHQVAMYVVYESPLQMLCESPSTYYREQETTAFISQIPTTWDETKVLTASVSDYVLIARRKGDNWYIGAMTDGTARALQLELDFLGTGIYEMTSMQDGPNTTKYAQDYQLERQEVDSGDYFTIQMSQGGGFAAILKPIN
jgi:alpha-glucosidase